MTNLSYTSPENKTYASITFISSINDLKNAYVKFNKMLGAMRLPRTVLRLVIYYAVIMFTTMAVNYDTLLNKEYDFSYILLLFVTTTLLFLVWIFVDKRLIKGKIEKFAVEIYLGDFEADNPKKIDFTEDGIVVTTGYSHSFYPYDEVKCAISDKYSYIFDFFNQGILFIVPKIGQQIDTLITVDNLLSDRLQNFTVDFKETK